MDGNILISRTHTKIRNVNNVTSDTTMLCSQVTKTKGWLNDLITDSAMRLLQWQFPELEGFEPSCLAYDGGFKRHSNLFVQIFNRSKQAGSTHWVTLSNINCVHDEVMMYNPPLKIFPSKSRF